MMEISVTFEDGATERFPAGTTAGEALAAHARNGGGDRKAVARAIAPRIEETMRAIVKEDLPVAREEVPKAEAIRRFRAMGERYKVEIIEGIPDETVSLYRQGEFVDLCRGPHVPSTGRIPAFRLTGLAGAYWRGDARNEQLQRIYGTAWAS